MPAVNLSSYFTRASAGWYYNAAGVLVQAAANAPRFDYDPVTKALRGLLVEETRTNLLFRSADFSVAPWTTGNVTPTPNQGVAPDGSNTVTKLDVTLNTNNCRQVVTVLPNTTYTFSFWAMRGTLPDVKWCAYDVTNAVDIVPATSYYSQLNSASLTRVSFTFTTPATCTSVGVYVARDTGATGSVYVWGGQLEQGAFPSSYIPTTSAQATRSADLCLLPTGVWFQQGIGTLYAEFEGLKSQARYAVGLTDTTANNLIGISVQGTSSLRSRITAATYVVENVLNSGYAGERAKAAVAWDGTNHVSCSNGAAVVSAASAAPAGVTTLGIGGYPLSGALGGLANGWLRDVRYYPRRLSNAELQALTT